MWWWWLGCTLEIGIRDIDEAPPGPDEHGPGADEPPPIDTAAADPDDDTEPDDPDDDTESGGGGGSGGGDDDPPAPVSPGAGDLVFVELMIDPSAVTDDHGEYLEIFNPTTDRVTLRDCVLADDDVDVWPIDDDVVVEPGDRVVLCADAASSTNGGVPCDGAYTWAMSEALALSNTGDELVLLSPSGVEVDRFEWTEDFVPTGAAMGLDPQYDRADENDRASRWCAQGGLLSGGDEGSPGRANDGC